MMLRDQTHWFRPDASGVIEKKVQYVLVDMERAKMKR